MYKFNRYEILNNFNCMVSEKGYSKGLTGNGKR